MLLLASVLGGVANGLDVLLYIYLWILGARAVVSWVSPDPRNPIVSFLYAATEPLCRVIRRWLPSSIRHFPLDVAFLVLLALVIFVRSGLVQALSDYALTLRMEALRAGLSS